MERGDFRANEHTGKRFRVEHHVDGQWGVHAEPWFVVCVSSTREAAEMVSRALNADECDADGPVIVNLGPTSSFSGFDDEAARRHVDIVRSEYD